MKGRVVFLIQLKGGREKEFLEAYQAIRAQVAREVKGHLVDQLGQAIDDPRNWLLTSEWQCIDNFLAWERDPTHHQLVKRMRDCWDEARSMKYVVLLETGHCEDSHLL
jgi:heme-degrading monooxygenase HmoA